MMEWWNSGIMGRKIRNIYLFSLKPTTCEIVRGLKTALLPRIRVRDKLQQEPRTL